MFDYWKKIDWSARVGLICALALIKLFSEVYETYTSPQKNDERTKLRRQNLIFLDLSSVKNLVLIILYRPI